MRVLFDIVHPAQVHFFKQCILKLKQRGDDILITARDKDVTLKLLDSLSLPYTVISRKGKGGMFGMGLELLSRDWKLFKISRTFKPDVMVARVGMSICTVGSILRTPRVVYDDMETAWLQSMISLPLASYICTGLGYYKDYGKRHVRFKGSPVLSYLSPTYYTPDPSPIEQAGLKPGEYIFIRTVSWGATHDVGKKGVTLQQLNQLIHRLGKYGKIIISSEGPLPLHLNEFKNPVPADKLHDLLAFAKLSLVEGGTMAAESAILGVPAICLNTYDFGYLKALEKEYDLICRPHSFSEALASAESLLNTSHLKQLWQDKQAKMLKDSQDVVQFQIDMIDRAAKDSKDNT